ncbi:hypothetical protein Aduo_000843 [Ancylostoma duodenale]
MNCIADAPEIVRQPPWIAAQCLQTTLSFATLLLSIKFVVTLKQSTLLNSSTVLLILLCTAFANLHALVLIGIQIHDMVTSALYTEPCDLSFKTSDCAIPTFVIMFCVAGMVLCQNALWIDRFVATRFSRFHHRNCKRFGFSLCTLVIALSLMVPFLIFHNDPYNDRVLTCVMTPAGSAAAVNLLFNAIVILNLAAITANIFIYLANQRMEKMLRFNLTQRFQAFENKLVSTWVGMIVSVQFAFMTTYSLAMFLIRTEGQHLPDITKQVLRIWFYLVPFSTASLPLISLFALRLCTKNRQASINRMTNQKADHSAYMNHLRKMWS